MSTGVHNRPHMSTENGSQLGSQHHVLPVEVLTAHDATAFIRGTRRTEGGRTHPDATSRLGGNWPRQRTTAHFPP